MTLVEKIKAVCRAKGITVSKLEEEAKISPRTIGRWDESKPSVDKVKRVAKVLDVSLDYLLDEENEEVSSDGEDLAEYLEMVRTRPEIRMMMKTQRNATKREVEQNVKFLQAIKEAYTDGFG